MKQLPSLNDMTPSIVAFAEGWAHGFMEANPKWCIKDFVCDTWHFYEGFDLNLTCEDGFLTIHAYASSRDEDGDIVTDHSDYRCVFSKGKKKQQHKVCEFCLNENWYGEQFDGYLQYLKYEHDGHVSAGKACRRCIQYAVFEDEKTTILELRNLDNELVTN